MLASSIFMSPCWPRVSCKNERGWTNAIWTNCGWQALHTYLWWHYGELSVSQDQECRLSHDSSQNVICSHRPYLQALVKCQTLSPRSECCFTSIRTGKKLEKKCIFSKIILYIDTRCFLHRQTSDIVFYSEPNGL